jgi:hypothetical protein
VRRGRGRPLDVPGHVAPAEAAEREPPRARFPQDLDDHLAQRLPGDGIDVAVRGDDEQRDRAQLAGEEREQDERRRIGGVQIVQHEHRRPRAAHVAQELRRRVEQAEPRSVRSRACRLGQSGEQGAQLGQDLGQLNGAGAELGAQELGRRVAHKRAERLHPRPVDGRAATFPAAAVEDAGSPAGGLARQLLGEPALAGARLAADEEERSATGKGGREAGAQLVELRRPAHEAVARRVRCGATRRGALEPRVLLEDRLLELPQGAAGLEAELADEDAACLAVDRERFGLSPGAIEGEHQLRREPFPERMGADEGSQLTHELVVAAGVEVVLDSPLAAREAELFEAGDLALREPLVRELGERRPAPERQGVRRPPGVGQPLEARDVELAVPDAQQVSGRLRSHAVFTERLAQLRDVDLERLVRPGRALVLPERLGQALRRHHLVGVHQQHRQQRPVLRAREVDRSLPVDHFEWAKDPELHSAPHAGLPAECRRNLTGTKPARAQVHRRIARADPGLRGAP